MAIEGLLPFFEGLITQYGYIALFFSSVISASTIIIPMPLYVLIFFSAGLGLDPFLVGVVSGVGSGIGEITGYLVGLGGSRLVGQRVKHVPEQVEMFHKYFNKYGFFAILFFGVIPFPFDIIGLMAGANNFGIKKFLLASIISKVIKTLMISYAGYLALPYLEFYILNPLAH